MSLLPEKEQEKVKMLFKETSEMRNPYDRAKIHSQIADILEPYLTSALEERLSEQFESFAECKNIE